MTKEEIKLLFRLLKEERAYGKYKRRIRKTIYDGVNKKTIEHFEHSLNKSYAISGMFSWSCDNVKIWHDIHFRWLALLGTYKNENAPF